MLVDNLGLTLYLFLFFLGLALGSFLNSWIWRRWENIRVTSGRSMCVHCHRQLNWWENIPFFSYVFLKGKCLTCKKAIPWFYSMVELFTAFAFVFIAWYRINFGVFTPLLFFRDIFFLTFLIIIFVFDALHRVIITRIVWLATIIGFLLNYFLFHFSLASMGLAALIAGGFFLLQYVISKGRWIGGGDIRLGIMMGVWIGWPGVLFALFVAYIFGGLVATYLLITKKKQKNSEIAFGTFLSIGTLFAIYYGEEVINWYLHLIK